MDEQLLKILNELEKKTNQKENLLKSRNNLENFNLDLNKSIRDLERQVRKEKLKFSNKPSLKYYVLKTFAILFWGILLGIILSYIIQGFMIANFFSILSSFIFMVMFIYDGLAYFKVSANLDKKFKSDKEASINEYLNRVLSNIENKKRQIGENEQEINNIDEEIALINEAIENLTAEKELFENPTGLENKQEKPMKRVLRKEHYND